MVDMVAPLQNVATMQISMPGMLLDTEPSHITSITPHESTISPHPSSLEGTFPSMKIAKKAVTTGIADL